MSDSLKSLVTLFEADLDIAHKIIHGSAEETVGTDSGPVRTFARALAEYDSQVARSETAQNVLAAEAAARDSHQAVEALSESDASKRVGYMPAGNGAVKSDLASAVQSLSAGGVGDFSVDNKLMIFCGDSTTEQMAGAGYGFDRITTLHRKSGGRFSKILGTINFGGSGYPLDLFVNGPELTPPVIQTQSNAGVGAWDYYGHKPIGAISLSTAMAWRVQQPVKVIWVVGFGINDCILNAAVGNLAQDEITTYIAQRLRTAVTRINAVFPSDEIVLRMPNPMTARPYNPAAGFPSQAAYPDFGKSVANDQALVEKWNQALRSAYLQIRASFPRTILFDTWEAVFGGSNTTLVAATELKYMGDLVHPSGPGYVRLVDALVNLLAPEANGKPSRRVEAEQRAIAVGGDAWTHYPHYFRDNPAYKKVLRLSTWVSIGQSHLDLSVDPATFFNLVDTSKPIYVAIGNAAAQSFMTYAPGATGANTRLTGIAPSAAMQAAIGEIEIFQFAGTGKTLDSYLVSQLANLRPRESYIGKISGAGSGYIDVTLDAVEGRLSTKYIEGVLGGKLLIGGGTDTVVSLVGFAVARAGTSTQRAFRLLKTGDYTTYNSKTCALVFDDAAPSPRAQEAVFTQRGVVPHAKNARGFVHCPARMSDGATLQIFLTEIIAQDVTVELYRPKWPTRTLVGSFTISANASGASLASGNPSDVPAGSIFEFVITSQTSQETGLIGLAVVPL